MARIALSGYMIRHPVAGNLLAFFHYALGLHRLGHQVAYIEEAGWPSSCYDPVARAYGNDPTRGLEVTRALFAAYGLPGPVCYFDGSEDRRAGGGRAEIRRLLEESDLLLDVGGSCWHPEFQRCRRRVLVDLDPLFTQLGRFGGSLLEQYHVHFTYGGNIGQPDCSVPARGIHWLATVPPVVRDIWQGLAPPAPPTTFTTVTNWHSYEPISFEGRLCGQKDVEFLRLIDLPRHTEERLELAVSGGLPETTRRLRESGWAVTDAAELSLDVATYQRYVAGSRGEFSVAKQAYVETRSGWFSDRSVCYLAAGRPVVLQDTGFSRWLATGRGVVAFRDLEEAAEGLRDVSAAYAAHSRAAAEIAERVFDHEVVLSRLLAAALDGAAHPPPRRETQETLP